jgi:putative addiction module component (TIGR02574 family)
MISTEELISEAVSLPLDIRLQLVERLLHSLHPTDKDIDQLWAAEAERRVEEIESGSVKPVPGDEVFRKIRHRLMK